MAEYNGSEQLQRTYVTPGLDQNLSLTSSGSTYYYLSDALGRVRQVISANEATQTRRGGTPRRGRRPHSYDYFAFGKVYGTPTENLTQPFRYTGRAWDPETSLYYYRARTYEARLGRLLSRDAELRVQVSAYVYVANAPLTHVDPSGSQRRDDNTPGTFRIGFTPPSGKVVNLDITYYPTEEQSKQCSEMKIIQLSRYDADFWLGRDHHKPWQVDYIGKKPPPKEWRSPIQPYPFYPYQIPWRRDWTGSRFLASPDELYMPDNPGWYGISPTLRSGTTMGVACVICTKCKLAGTVLACFTWEVTYSGGKWENLDDRSGVRPTPKNDLPEDVVKGVEDLGYQFGE